MHAERDLTALLRNMQPSLAATPYVFCTFADFTLPDGVAPVCQFREAEGLTAIIDMATAKAKRIDHVFESRMITLTIHSDLAAIGFLAAICAALAREGISCNAVSAYYHDHLFVPADRADDAMAVLNALSQR
jgi:hypothetical protein